MTAPEQGAPMQFGPWALENYQLADLQDTLKHLAYLTHAAGNFRSQPTPPEPTPRPGARKPPRKQSAANVVYLNSLRAKPA